uniref:Secreted protein n=1 Tax=Panstrongylus lignarius TaxID=156445 RepID=A0A224XZ86_9HEMI
MPSIYCFIVFKVVRMFCFVLADKPMLQLRTVMGQKCALPQFDLPNNPREDMYNSSFLKKAFHARGIFLLFLHVALLSSINYSSVL